MTKKINASENSNSSSSHKKVIFGKVVSNKMQKTIVVKADRKVQHSQYGKYVTVSKKFKAHDEKQTAKIGDKVEIVECRPLSKDKRWALRKIIQRSSLVDVKVEA